MRPAFLKLLVVALAALSAAAVYRHVTKSANNPSSGVPREVISLYSSWKQTHGKLYATPAENDHRLRVFYSQKLFVDQANADYINLKLERDGEVINQAPFTLNAFADLSSEEFKSKYTGAAQEDSITETVAISSPKIRKPKRRVTRDFQTSYDVRVRNQGACGSCWAFSAIATYEKFYYNNMGVRVDLSQQHLVDCDDNSSGCEGGLASNALFHISQHGVALASSYPYVGADTACKTDVPIVAKIGFDIAKVEFDMQYAAEKIHQEGQHISVSVYSSGKFRFLSKKGDFIDASALGECSKAKDHAINAVDEQDGKLQLLNSWGTSWGDQGMKFVKPCSDSQLWSVVSYITTPELESS